MTRRGFRIGATAIAALLLPPVAFTQSAVGTAFTYQGQLKQNGQPANGNFDMEFRLYAAPVAGTQIGSPVVFTSVPVASGLFSVVLDSNGEFGVTAFNGDERWIEVRVNDTPLMPRQPMTATPYARRAMSAPNAHALDAADGSPTDAVFVDNEGDVGIGILTPGYRLHVDGAVRIESDLVMGAGDLRLSSDRSVGTQAGNLGIQFTDFDMLFKTNPTWGEPGFERMRIDPNGNVGIAVTDPSEKLDTSGTARLRGIGASAGTTVVADANGKLWKQSSSVRYKHNVADLTPARDAALDLRPVKFEWNSTGEPDVGLIAEEVATVLPELVICDAEGQPEGVKYDKVALYLLDVVKGQRTQIATQRNELADLRLRLEKIEAALSTAVRPQNGRAR